MTDLNLEELKSACRHSAQVKWDEKNYTAIVYRKWNNKEIPLAIIPFPEWHENRRCGEDEQLDRARAYTALPQLIAEVRRLREELSTRSGQLMNVSKSLNETAEINRNFAERLQHAEKKARVLAEKLKVLKINGPCTTEYWLKWAEAKAKEPQNAE